MEPELSAQIDILVSEFQTLVPVQHHGGAKVPFIAMNFSHLPRALANLGYPAALCAKCKLIMTDTSAPSINLGNDHLLVGSNSLILVRLIQFHLNHGYDIMHVVAITLLP